MVTMSSPRLSQAPYPHVHLSSLFERTAQHRANQVALVNSVTGAQYTFREAWEASSRLARRLQEDGIKKGDRVAIFAPNSPEWVIAFHAILLAGATATTMNPLYKERELEHQFEDCTPTAVFCSGLVKDVAQPVWEGVGAKKDDRPGPFYIVEEAWALAGGSPGPHSPVAINPLKDIAILPYSSGTTGGPKGVMLTHHNVASNVRQTLATGMVDGYAVLIDFLPFFHIYGMVVLMNVGLTMGARQVIMPRFDMEQFLELTQRHKATNLYVVPPAMLALANIPGLEKYDLSSVRFIMSGAAPLAPDVGRRVEERFGTKVVQGYGMTETSPVTHVNILDRNKPGSVGPPVADTRQRIVDMQSGAELGIGEVGELLIEGPQVMKGYWNRPDATGESILEGPDYDASRQRSDDPLALPFWHDRWLRTGDIASMDDEGYVTIHDRAKEMIKFRGYQIAPAELEAVLVEHPSIVDAAVIPKYDDEAGEVPKAFVVVRDGQDVGVEEIQAFVSARVAPYKKIREVEFIPAIPKSLSGKILRRELIEQERAKAGDRSVGS